MMAILSAKAYAVKDVFAEAEGEDAVGEIYRRIVAADDARRLSADGVTGFLLVTEYETIGGTTTGEMLVTVGGARYAAAMDDRRETR